MACTDYSSARKIVFFRTVRNYSGMFCTSGLSASETYKDQGDAAWLDGYPSSRNGLVYSYSSADRRYRNIEMPYSYTDSYVYPAFEYFLRVMRNAYSPSYGVDLSYAVVRRSTDLEHDNGTIRLYPGDYVYFSGSGGQGTARGSGTGRSWLRCYGYSKGSFTETFGGYVLEPYSNSRSYYRLERH